MIIAQGDGRHQTRHDLTVAHDRLHRTAAKAEDGDFGQVHDGREMCATDGSLIGDGERAALHLVGRNLPVAGFRSELFEFLCEVEHGLFVHIADDRNHQTLVSIHRNAEVDVFLDDDFVRNLVEAGIENLMLLQRRGHGFQDERCQRELDAFLLVVGGKFLPQLAELGEINVIELRHAGHAIPAFTHAAGDDLAQRRNRLLENRAELREINLHRGGLGRSRTSRRSGRGLGGGLLQLGDVSADVA